LTLFHISQWMMQYETFVGHLQLDTYATPLVTPPTLTYNA